MKEKLKKVGKYLLILCLLLIGLAAIALIFLFFVPSASIFGICYKNGASKTYYSKSYNAIDNNISYVSLQNLSYPVRVENSEDNNISVAVHDKTFGYVLKKNSEVNINCKLISDEDSKQLIVSVSEPKGFAYKGDSYISLKLPKAYTLSLNLSNKNAGAKVNLEGTKISTFSYTSNYGDINLNKGTILNSLNLNIARAHFVVSKDFNINNANVNLKLTAGVFDAKSISGVINSLNIQGLTTGTINIKACNNLVGTLSSGGGKLNVNTLSGILNFTSTDTDITIDKYLGLGGDINLKKAGDITIGELNCPLSAETNSGNLTINNFASNTTTAIQLKSDRGDISIKNIALEGVSGASLIDDDMDEIEKIDSPIWVSNNKGNINLVFASSGNLDRSAYITSADGNVNVSNAYRIKLFTTGKANATINYLKIIGKSYLSANGSGNLTIYTPTNKHIPDDNLNKYTLDTTSTKGNVFIDIAQIRPTNQNPDKPIYVGTDEENPQGDEWQNNVITALTQHGTLTVRDY